MGGYQVDASGQGQGVLPGLRDQGRCLVMGVVNVTPDSFSDGGAWYGTEPAIRHGLDLAAEGADLVDVGGESTRPGAQRVSEAEELRRVIPVIGALASAGVVVSVDTMRARVAAAAVEAGACLVNDVSGGLADPQMPRIVAKTGAAYVVMHWRGHSHDMMQRAVYLDVVAEVIAELRLRVDTVVGEGVDPSRIVLDPGLGFAKRPGHNWELLTRLPEISTLGGSGHSFPVLIGASRKSFLSKLLAGQDKTPRPFTECDGATVGATALAAAAGAWAVRVHKVPPNVDAVRVAAAWRAAAPAAPGAAPAAPAAPGAAPASAADPGPVEQA
jgi:dihydropteroate synthase